jgi:5,6-dimethylbenzimidazole synthase
MSTSSPHRYPQEQIDAVYRVIRERRDMRHFLPDPVAPALLERLLQAAHQGPSVGFMQPWRFIRIRSDALRQQIHALVEQERIATARALGQREDEFMRLKVEGILECGELLVAALMDRREPTSSAAAPAADGPGLAVLRVAEHVAGRPCRRAGDGLGVAVRPGRAGPLLHLPQGAEPVAVLCLGHVPAFYDKPMLEQEQWAPANVCKTWSLRPLARARSITSMTSPISPASQPHLRRRPQRQERPRGTPGAGSSAGRRHEIVYLATSRRAASDDAEMQERIAHHQQRRRAWVVMAHGGRTAGTGTGAAQPAGPIRGAGRLPHRLAGQPAVCRGHRFPEMGPIDPPRPSRSSGLTSWALQEVQGTVILVSNEVGMGIVPQGPSRAGSSTRPGA